MGRLDDKIALITGSDSGINQASAVEFAREGADVIVNHLEDERGANAGGSHHDCCKGALRMLTRTLALEVAPDAIDDPKLRDEQVQSIPLKRAAQPEEIARLVLSLASSDADHVTGSEYVMDGGSCAARGRAPELMAEHHQSDRSMR